MIERVSEQILRKSCTYQKKVNLVQNSYYNQMLSVFQSVLYFVCHFIEFI